MKVSRYILIAATGFLVGLSNTALAHSCVSVSIGGGYRSSRRSCCADYKRDSRKIPCCYSHHKWSWVWWKYCPRRRINISRSVYRYDRKLGYCVAIAPMIIEKQRVIVPVSSPQVVQLQQFDESTLQLNMKLQHKKSELLKQLETPYKGQRIEAIRELAGFSFDDKVRYALEDVLLSESDAELRKEAAQALGNTNNIKAIAALEKARVEDPNEDVRKAADIAIEKIEEATLRNN